MSKEPSTVIVDPPSNGLGLSTVVAAALLAACLTFLIILRSDISALWAILLYPLIGTLVTFVFAAITIVLRR